MIRMENVSKAYTTDTIKTQALKSFSLEVSNGEFVAVTGPSGSGKTTFLNLAGLLEPVEQGEYWLDGENTNQLNDRQRSQLRNQKIGFIFQSFNLIPELNLADNVDVPLRYRGFSKQERKQRIERALEQVGLAQRMNHYPSQLSGGQQQRVAIARALAGSPGILFADEPTGNLDSQMAAGVMHLLKEIHANGTTIVMVTHDREQACLADRIIQVKDGQVNEMGLEQKIA